MARKLNPDEHETFNQLLQDAEFSGQQDHESFSIKLGEKTKANLRLSPKLDIWFGDDVSGLPQP